MARYTRSTRRSTLFSRTLTSFSVTSVTARPARSRTLAYTIRSTDWLKAGRAMALRATNRMSCRCEASDITGHLIDASVHMLVHAKSDAVHVDVTNPRRNHILKSTVRRGDRCRLARGRERVVALLDDVQRDLARERLCPQAEFVRRSERIAPALPR